MSPNHRPASLPLARCEKHLRNVIDAVNNGFKFKRNDIRLNKELTTSVRSAFAALGLAAEARLWSLLGRQLTHDQDELKFEPMMVCLTLKEGGQFRKEHLEIFGSYCLTFQAGAAFAGRGAKVEYINDIDIVKHSEHILQANETQLYQTIGCLQHGSNQDEQEWRVLQSSDKEDRLRFRHDELDKVRVLTGAEKDVLLEACPVLLPEQVVVEPDSASSLDVSVLESMWFSDPG